MLAIRLPQSIEKRLEKLARRTGRTKTYYVREAILEHLEEIEDLYLAEGAMERIRSGEERTIALKQVRRASLEIRAASNPFKSFERSDLNWRPSGYELHERQRGSANRRERGNRSGFLPASLR